MYNYKKLKQNFKNRNKTTDKAEGQIPKRITQMDEEL
jgi:hypothetical protein